MILSPLNELVRIKIFSICVHLLVALSWSPAGEIKVFNYDSGGQSSYYRMEKFKSAESNATLAP